jgi:hypothetical protein
VPAVFRRAGPCRPTGVAGSPGTAWWNGPGRPGHASSRAGPCLGRAKKPGRVPGHRALGCMLIYRCIRAWEAELRRSVQLVRGMQEKRGLPAMTTQRRFPLNFSCYITFFITSFTFHSLLFHFPQQFPLNTPSIPTTTIKYHFLYLLFIHYQFFIY